jgi:hypothetical protein
MSLSDESKRIARLAEYGALVDNLQRLMESNPSAGDFSAVFANYLASIIAESPVLDDVQKETIRRLCQIVEERPFPAKPLALLALRNLDTPHLLAPKLEAILEDKREVEDQIGAVAARNSAKLGLVPHSRVLVVGFSYMFPLILPALPDESTLTICTLRHMRREMSEGEALRKALLERQPALRVEVRDDQEAVDMLRAGAFHTLLMSAKAIGLYNSELCIIRSVTGEDLPALAREANTTVIVAGGKYKIWPQDLFSSAAACVSANPKYDRVMPATDASWLLTEEDVFSPPEYCGTYNSFLTSDLDNYPAFVVEPSPSRSTSIPDEKSLLRELLGKLTNEQRQRLLAPDPIGSEGAPPLTEADARVLTELYAALVDKEFSEGLTDTESRQQDAIGKVLDHYEDALFEPLKKQLQDLWREASSSQ